jgi:hypothetical protein
MFIIVCNISVFSVRPTEHLCIRMLFLYACFQCDITSVAITVPSVIVALSQCDAHTILAFII